MENGKTFANLLNYLSNSGKTETICMWFMQRVKRTKILLGFAIGDICINL